MSERSVQVQVCAMLSPRNVAAIEAMRCKHQWSFSRALDTVVSEGLAAGIPFFQPLRISLTRGKADKA